YILGSPHLVKELGRGALPACPDSSGLVRVRIAQQSSIPILKRKGREENLRGLACFRQWSG
ncbi:MAG: hypothetical protein AABZ15_03410, partial [Nitrospirota bacterium]